MSIAEQPLTTLRSEGYEVIKQILKPDVADHCCKYLTGLFSSDAIPPGDSQVPNTPSSYGNPLTDKLLEDLTPVVERISQCSLYPTYSYFRIYKHNDQLQPHKDRAACEISMSLALGIDSDAPWPLWIEGFKGTNPVGLDPGDALVYLGTECMHWREPFNGKRAIQVFLHYVDRAGRFADWKYDKREALAHHHVPKVLNSVS